MPKATLIAPSSTKPTLFNRDFYMTAFTVAAASAAIAVTGGVALTGPLMGTLVSAPVSLGTFVAAGALGAVAGVLPGLMRSHRMNRDLHEGKRLDPPTLFNKTMIIGAAIGVMAGIALAGPILGAASAILPAAAAKAMSDVAIWGVLGGLGGLIGGGIGHKQMSGEYNLGLQYHSAQAQLQHRARMSGVSAERQYSVTPQEAALLESRLRQSVHGNHSFAQQIREERARAADMAAGIDAQN